MGDGEFKQHTPGPWLYGTFRSLSEDDPEFDPEIDDDLDGGRWRLHREYGEGFTCIAQGPFGGPRDLEEIIYADDFGTLNIENLYDELLIIAAPELLAALKACRDAILQAGLNTPALAIADAVIKKATTPVDEKNSEEMAKIYTVY